MSGMFGRGISLAMAAAGVAMMRDRGPDPEQPEVIGRWNKPRPWALPRFAAVSGIQPGTHGPEDPRTKRIKKAQRRARRARRLGERK